MIKRSLLAAKPEDVGIDSERLEAVFARAMRETEEFFPTSAQVAVARHGKIGGMRTFGVAVQGGQEQPATDQTLYTVFSSTKAIVAAAVWLLLEEGSLRLGERVSEIIPEFSTNGKDVVTVDHVLLHIAGFPRAPFHPDHWEDREALLKAFGRWRLRWEPESRFEYHATSAHWVLAEIINRRSGSDYREFIRERVTGPMGLDELFVGLPSEYDERVAAPRYVVEPVEPPGGWGEVTPEAILRFGKPFARRAGVPGAGAVGGAAELAIFYQTLVNGGESAGGAQVIKPETIELATTERTSDRFRDAVLNIPIYRGLSVVIAGDDGNSHLRGFGRVASPRTFGHAGAGGQIAWGDPETGISLGYCTNGFADYVTIGRRVTALSSLAASCAI